MPDLWNSELAGQPKIQGLLSHYRSGVSNLGRDFFSPCFKFCTEYKRAVGYFSSKALLMWLEALPRFETNSVKIYLLISPELSVEDRAALGEAMEEGERQRLRQITADRLIQELLEDPNTAEPNRVKLFAWMVANEHLILRFAFPEHVERPGIFHEKIGVFQFPWGDRVAFTGSANESENGYERNYESIDVYRSWIDGDRERVGVKSVQFEEAWAAKAIGLKVLPLSPESAALIRSAAPSEKPAIASKGGSSGLAAKEKPTIYGQAHGDSLLSSFPTLPSWLILRPYQQEAIANWFDNKGRGTLKMATGSGKTITALAIATQLYEKIQLQALIIVCPYRHLVQQWARECLKFGITDPILAFESVSRWQERLSNQLYNVRAGNQAFLTVITTNATLMTPGFQSQLLYFPQKTLIVGDEAHNLGARLEASLPRSVGLRLGLSATPERYFDDEGTEALLEYFGAVLQPEFTLQDAIAQGALVHYLYYPILVELTEPEVETYLALTTRIGRAMAMGADPEENEGLAALLNQRARLVGAAANKLDALQEVMGSRLNTSYTLFYCGDGSVEDGTSAESQRQLAAVARLLGHELGYQVNTYTAETTLDEREDLRRQFETGDLQGLVAIRCLDEGVDIPAIQTAVILASSGNPRQFIQRRGRVLRPHPNKQRATIFDMIVLPPDLERETLDLERNFLRKELTRFVEFADLADNAGEARVRLLDLQRRYGLLDV
jgi:DNA phosphorothioation system restriction enzyme